MGRGNCGETRTALSIQKPQTTPGKFSSLFPAPDRKNRNQKTPAPLSMRAGAIGVRATRVATVLRPPQRRITSGLWRACRQRGCFCTSGRRARSLRGQNPSQHFIGDARYCSDWSRRQRIRLPRARRPPFGPTRRDRRVHAEGDPRSVLPYSTLVRPRDHKRAPGVLRAEKEKI